MIEGHLRFQPSRPWLKSAAAHLECQPWHKMVTAPRSNRLPQIFSDGSRYQTFVKALKLRSCKEAKKQRSKEAKKQRSKEDRQELNAVLRDLIGVHAALIGADLFLAA